MKRIKCPKCDLNYMVESENMCDICKRESPHNIHHRTYSFNKLEDYKKAMESARSSASPWFFNKYFEDINAHLDELTTDLGYKKEYIKRIFEIENRDSEIGGTTTRVDSVIRYIRLEKELIVFLENSYK